MGKEEYSKMTAFEKAGMDNFLLREQVLMKELIDAKVSSTGERYEDS
jgi:hypothetical protein